MISCARSFRRQRDDLVDRVPGLVLQDSAPRVARGEAALRAGRGRLRRPRRAARAPKPARRRRLRARPCGAAEQSISTTAGEGGVTEWAGPTKLAQIYHGTKMFWHSREARDRHRREQAVQHARGHDVQRDREEALPPLYVDLNVMSEQLDAKNVEVMVERAAEKEEKDKRRRLTPAEKLEIARRIEGESLRELRARAAQARGGRRGDLPAREPRRRGPRHAQPGPAAQRAVPLRGARGGQLRRQVAAARRDRGHARRHDKSTKEAGKAQRLLEISDPGVRVDELGHGEARVLLGAKRKLYLASSARSSASRSRPRRSASRTRRRTTRCSASRPRRATPRARRSSRRCSRPPRFDPSRGIDPPPPRTRAPRARAPRANRGALILPKGPGAPRPC